MLTQIYTCKTVREALAEVERLTSLGGWVTKVERTCKQWHVCYLLPTGERN